MHTQLLMGTRFLVVKGTVLMVANKHVNSKTALVDNQKLTFGSTSQFYLIVNITFSIAKSQVSSCNRHLRLSPSHLAAAQAHDVIRTRLWMHRIADVTAGTKEHRSCYDFNRNIWDTIGYSSPWLKDVIHSPNINHREWLYVTPIVYT